MTSDSFTTLLDRNRRFAEQFKAGNLPIRPRMSTIILTCLDSRVDPTHIFGLGLGDAVVMRNAGGRITSEVMRDLAILGVLAANMPGPSAMQPELIVMHHTDCGMCRLANAAIQRQVAERLGVGVDEATAMAIIDPTASVQDDIERLRQTPETPDQLIVSGFVYDVKNGTIDQVAPPAPLRTTTGRPTITASPAMLAG
jgi:carbonic anhydrase